MNPIKLQDANRMEVVRVLTTYLEELGLIDINKLSENGVELTEKQMKIMLTNIVENINYAVIRGHMTIQNVATVTYSDKYFAYERINNSIVSGNLLLYLNQFNTFKFYVSESNWIDLHFNRSDGSYVTMVLVP